MNIIETHELSKNFKARGGKNQPKVVEAVRGIDLTVKQGDIFGFLGPNGAGKTTTLRMLATLLQPDGGTAMVAGHNLRQKPAEVRKKIGYVSQEGGTDKSLTGRENLVLQGQLHNMSKAEAQERAAVLIDKLELTNFADRQSRTYSGGQRRRLDLATGMMHKPDLLFLDEPTTGLDPQSRARLWEEVKQLRDTGTTVFLTTHYLEEADALCDQLAIVDYGEIVVEGTPETLKRQVAGDIVTLGLATQNGAVKTAFDLLNSQEFVREAHMNQAQLQLYVERGEESLPTILRLLDTNNLPIQTIALSRPSLDDVFLRQTGRSLREAEA
jgi:ABC-2 type transport system ATP-binding protein